MLVNVNYCFLKVMGTDLKVLSMQTILNQAENIKMSENWSKSCTTAAWQITCRVFRTRKIIGKITVIKMNDRFLFFFIRKSLKQ